MIQSRLSESANANTYEVRSKQCPKKNMTLLISPQITNVSFGKRDTHPGPADLGQHAASAQSFPSASDEESAWESSKTRAIPELGERFPSDRPLLNHMLMENSVIPTRQRTNRANRLHGSTTSSEARSTNSVSYGRSSNNISETPPRDIDNSGHRLSGVDKVGTSAAVTELNLESCLTPSIGHSKELSLVQPDFTSIELEALDYLTAQSSNLSFCPPTTQSDEILTWNPVGDPHFWSSPFANNSTDAESPDNSMSYPNATYKNLHTILYHHMVETARNTALTRHGTPVQSNQEPTAISNDAPQSSGFGWPTKQLQELGLGTTPSKSTKIHKRRQLELWRNYLDEIAVWLDMFDSERHFQLQIPQLAKSAGHLHYSVLALSARQIERKDPEKPYTESLGLYQEAIQLILQELHTLDTAVIASCVLLCVLEMMSSAPRAWSRHLDGCAMLLEAAGVNGVVGGVRQSLFWCFARMDVWGGFLGDTLTKIPTSRWFVPSKSMVDAISHFKEGSGCDSYANYAVFLCASVVNVISNKGDSSVGQYGADSTFKPTFSAQWKALFDLLEDWYNRRPEYMEPIISFPSNSEEHQQPFPSVLYSNSPAINGNQLYHAATLLMLQEKPKDVHLVKSAKSILWHARQICGIAASNHSHGPWINALQPLWIAGKIMSHASEHMAILEVLASIERETGWATAWRAQDLKDYWGDANG